MGELIDHVINIEVKINLIEPVLIQISKTLHHSDTSLKKANKFDQLHFDLTSIYSQSSHQSLTAKIRHDLPRSVNTLMVNLHFFYVQFRILCCNNVVLTTWLSLGTKPLDEGLNRACQGKKTIISLYKSSLIALC